MTDDGEVVSMGKTRQIPKVSCVILAGGLSKRMGADKSFLDLAGRPMVEWTLESLKDFGDETIIVTNSPKKYAHWGTRVVTDVYPGHGTLGGLYSALYHAQFERSIVVACDMPFLNRPLLRYQLLLSRDFDVVVPRVGKWLEPLHAVYSKNCLDPIKAAMDAGEYRVLSFFSQVRVRHVDLSEVELFDPEHRSFMNVNTPADLETVRQVAMEMLAQRQRRHTA